MTNWKAVDVVIEGHPIDVGGINPWDYEWRRVESDRLELPHPAYPSQLHAMNVYEIDGPDGAVRFATGELSANVWGFYLPAA